GFTDRSDDVPAPRKAPGLTLQHWHDAHHRLVKRRTDDVVHRAVDHGEVLVGGFLQVFHAGEHHAGIGADRAARFEQQRQLASVEAWQDGADVLFRRGRVLILVAHAQSTTEVEVADRDAGR